MLLSRHIYCSGTHTGSRPRGSESSRSAALPRVRPQVGLTRARLQQLQRAYQSQASHALQQQQEQRGPLTSAGPPRQQQQQPEAEHHINPDEWDLSYWHYQPWWLQPPMIIATGVAFVAASLVLDNEELSKTLLLAAGPTALFYGIFLFVLPRRFKSFAVEYIESHPEAEEAAREQQQQQVDELIQQQQAQSSQDNSQE